MDSQLIVILVFLFSSFSNPVAAIGDRLIPGESISGNQTIVSSGGSFVLGFFGSSGSPARYVGIWYNNIGERTVVWVANRDSPLKDSSALLTITGNGNLALLSSERSVIWSSSNVSYATNSTDAVLLDSGNFVLRENGANIWQSFDHPTDTFLPNMKLQFNNRTGFRNRLIAWKDVLDPSSGNFSFGIDPITGLQLIIWQGSKPYWRSHVWSGNLLFGTRADTTASIYIISTETDYEQFNLTFSATQGSVPARYMLAPSGKLETFLLDEKSRKWAAKWAVPSSPCDFYNQCGPSGICNSSASSLTCSCLQGFSPKNDKEWNNGNYSGGCISQLPIKCDKTDGFVRVKMVKLPDQFLLIRNASAAKCELQCLSSCNCTAYAQANVSDWASVSRCLLWIGDFVDLKYVESGREDLNVRLGMIGSVTGPVSSGSLDKGKTLLAIILPSLAIGILLLSISLYHFRKRSVKQEGKKGNKSAALLNDFNSYTIGVDKGSAELPLLDFSNVAAATDNFSAENKLGEGGFGPVFKGILLGGQDVAVKRLSRSSGQGFEEFKNEVELIARLQHRNLVRLLGWCAHGAEKILVYEFLPNKSLDRFIFDPTRSAELDWQKRSRIIEGITQGIDYLHRHSRLRVIHRDLKPSNILLDSAMHPKISDFGLARIFEGNQTEGNTDRVIGTYGYMSPEYAMNGLFSEKSDIFSLGVILLEIISGKKSTGYYLYEESANLLQYVWRLWEEQRELELVDSTMAGSYNESEMLRYIKVGLLCIQENAADRPTMSSVISMLGAENAAIPSPRKPGSTVGRDSNLSSENSSYNNMASWSVCEVTLTDVGGR